MQTQVLWCCDGDVPFSWDLASALLGAVLGSAGRGGKLLIRSLSENSGTAERCSEILNWLKLDGALEITIGSVTKQDRLCYGAAAARLITEDAAYCGGDETRRTVLFRLPLHPKLNSTLAAKERRNMPVHAGITVEVSGRGIEWRPRDGKVHRCCFAAMPDLTLYRNDGRVLFRGEEHVRQIAFGKKFVIAGSSYAEFRGRDVLFRGADREGRTVPLELLEDPEIIDESGNPSPLLTGVLSAISCKADITVLSAAGEGKGAAMQTLLFDALGYPPPDFLLLPVCDFTGAPGLEECRKLGFAPEAVLEELCRLNCGYPPSRKVRSLKEWAQIFRERSSGFGYRKFDRAALENLNGMFLAALPLAEFIRRAGEYAAPEVVQDVRFPRLAEQRRSGTVLLSEAAQWKF